MVDGDVWRWEDSVYLRGTRVICGLKWTRACIVTVTLRYLAISGDLARVYVNHFSLIAWIRKLHRKLATYQFDLRACKSCCIQGEQAHQ